MTNSVLDDLVARARLAAVAEDSTSALVSLLQNSFSQTTAISEAIGKYSENEVMLFEDNTCSIWSCRYHSDVVFAPHEHCMRAHIAVYRGSEVQVIYQREPGRLQHVENRVVKSGAVLTLGPDAVHAVTAGGSEVSHALHIYEGQLTTASRSLFDWDTGEEIDFTMENFHAMQRKPGEVDGLR